MPDAPSVARSEMTERARGALLGAAVGDALGWPQEPRGGRVGGRKQAEPSLTFIPWIRRAGGRWATHEEPIQAGEYSDDTQLILAVGRSLLCGEEWWRVLTEVELPFWLAYERGGGGATKRAASAWSRGERPWQPRTKATDPQQYYFAGGNGVAMRVLPHAIWAREGVAFEAVAERVFADGATTHGHPRALVGAQLYAYALWRGLHREGPLGYGELVADLLDHADEWASLSAAEVLGPEWRQGANHSQSGSYARAWKTAVQETRGLLEIAEGAIQRGALAVDRAALDAIGCFDRRIGGAGTITAVGALFLASRYASQPEQGLVAAAFADGADTDTLASMTAALLGAINGSDWLQPLAHGVQDERYLIGLADRLLDGRVESEPSTSRPIPDELIAALASGARDMTLPGGRAARLLLEEQLPARSERVSAVAWRVESEDGQSFWFKKVTQAPSKPRSQPREQVRHADLSPANVLMVLPVTDLAISSTFYEQLVGLPISKRTAERVTVAGQVVLEEAREDQPHLWKNGREEGDHQRLIVLLDASLLPAMHKRIAAATEVWDAPEAGFRCFDPDGHVVEFQPEPGSTKR